MLFICCLRIANAPILGSIESIVAYSDRQCRSLALFHEARGEPLVGQRSVLAVIENRAALQHKTSCQVILQKGQFEFVSAVQWHVTPAMLEQLDKAYAQRNVLPKNVIYFRSGGFHKFGKRYKKIGRHYFSSYAK